MKDFLLTLVGAHPDQLKKFLPEQKAFALVFLAFGLVLLLSAAVFAAIAYLGWHR